jgi:hypothetical protein
LELLLYFLIKIERQDIMSKGIYKKLTFEDRFDRKYRCNSYRFVHKMKRENRKKMRRILKKEIEQELE